VDDLETCCLSPRGCPTASGVVDASRTASRDGDLPSRDVAEPAAELDEAAFRRKARALEQRVSPLVVQVADRAEPIVIVLAG